MSGRGSASSPGFDEWYQAEWPRLVATFTLATGDRELAREVAAEALTRALQRWSTVGQMASPGGWTYRVGLNLLHRHHWRRRLERQALGRSVSPPSPDASLDSDLDVWDAVASLPPRERAAVALRYGADMTEADVASVLGMAAGTVSATLNHARAHLRRALSPSIGEVPHG